MLIKPTGHISEATPAVLKYWLPEMTKLIGQLGNYQLLYSSILTISGVVKSLCHKRSLVHVHFYNPENAVLQEWWYPIGVIHMPSQKQGSIKASKKSDETPLDLEKQASDGFVDLSQVYARRFLVTLLRSVPLSINQLLPMRDMVKLASHHFLSAPESIASANLLMQADQESNKMQFFEMKLVELYNSSTADEKKKITELLIQVTNLARHCVVEILRMELNL